MGAEQSCRCHSKRHRLLGHGPRQERNSTEGTERIGRKGWQGRLEEPRHRDISGGGSQGRPGCDRGTESEERAKTRRHSECPQKNRESGPFDPQSVPRGATTGNRVVDYQSAEQGGNTPCQNDEVEMAGRHPEPFGQESDDNTRHGPREPGHCGVADVCGQREGHGDRGGGGKDRRPRDRSRYRYTENHSDAGAVCQDPTHWHVPGKEAGHPGIKDRQAGERHSGPGPVRDERIPQVQRSQHRHRGAHRKEDGNDPDDPLGELWVKVGPRIGENSLQQSGDGAAVVPSCDQREQPAQGPERKDRGGSSGLGSYPEGRRPQDVANGCQVVPPRALQRKRSRHEEHPDPRPSDAAYRRCRRRTVEGQVEVGGEDGAGEPEARSEPVPADSNRPGDDSQRRHQQRLSRLLGTGRRHYGPGQR